MRQERTVQASIFDLFAGHEIGRELKAMSEWLDAHRALLSLVAEDLRRDGVRATGRQGLPAEAVLRCALLKQHRQLSYEELAFHLEDSASFRAFARLPWAWSPKKSVLQKTISAIRAETWEAINRTLLASASAEKLEQRPRGAAGQHRHRGADARAERQQPALGRGAGDGAPVAGGGCLARRRPARGWRDHRRAAKKRGRAIEFTRGRPQRVQLYRELIKITRATLAYLRRRGGGAGAGTQPGRRALAGQGPPLSAADRADHRPDRAAGAGRRAVPARDKLVSLFEPHADIIVKGSRDVDYGHKLNLTTGRSGLILDLVVEAGNPADSERLLPMLERHIAF